MRISIETIALTGSGFMYMSIIGESCYYSFLSSAEALDKYGVSYGAEKYKRNSEYPREGNCIILHKHQASHSYCQHGKSKSLR